MKILISGSTGLLGTHLRRYFQSQNSLVLPIVRVSDTQPRKAAIAWNREQDWFDSDGMEDATAIIHLAGENVGAGRWSKRRKHEILESRTTGTRQLVTAIRNLSRPPSVFLCASATGYYGFQGDAPRHESDGPGEGFLANVCQAWEHEASQAQAAGIRTISLRFGVILDPAGGALKKMLLPFRLGLGGRIGSGRQFFPWVAAPEISLMIQFLIESQQAQGPVNIVAPESITNSDLTRQLAKHLRRPAVIPLPSPVVRILFGEMGTEMLLGSCRAQPSALSDWGYDFQYRTLQQTLGTILPQ